MYVNKELKFFWGPAGDWQGGLEGWALVEGEGVGW